MERGYRSPGPRAIPQLIQWLALSGSVCSPCASAPHGHAATYATKNMIAPRRESFDLDAEFPLGDGTADLHATVVCPFCHQSCDIVLDPGSGPVQDYIEDCEVCCRPWNVNVQYRSDGSADVSITPADL
jgi:hypothetical protein